MLTCVCVREDWQFRDGPISDRHNEDGSYSYGFEAADGSYKIESKYPNGEVYGKYGFVDDSGNVREVEYGATRRGFEPVGSGINVPPPTLTGNSINGNEPEDDGQYREDPSIYHTDPRYTNGERYDQPPKYKQQLIAYNSRQTALRQIAPEQIAPASDSQPRWVARDISKMSSTRNLSLNFKWPSDHRCRN